MGNLKTFKVKAKSENSKGSIVLLHGYGANGQDLIGISSYIKLRDLNFDWYFIEAPLSPAELAAFGGKAWFNLSMQSFMNNMSSSNFEDFYKQKNDDFKNSLEALKQTIWNLELSNENTYIGGFSQGAMMASHVFFDDQNLWSGSILMSGAPYQHMSWKKLSNEGDEKKTKRVFQSHGLKDPVLPKQCGEDLFNHLLNHGIKPSTQWFQGGHEIPVQVLDELSKFLSKS